MEKLIMVLLVLVGIIYLLFVFGVLGVEWLFVLYGIFLVEFNIDILMCYCVILFGIFGLFLFYVVF